MGCAKSNQFDVQMTIQQASRERRIMECCKFGMEAKESLRSYTRSATPNTVLWKTAAMCYLSAVRLQKILLLKAHALAFSAAWAKQFE